MVIWLSCWALHEYYLAFMTGQVISHTLVHWPWQCQWILWNSNSRQQGCQFELLQHAKRKSCQNSGSSSRTHGRSIHRECSTAGTTHLIQCETSIQHQTISTTRGVRGRLGVIDVWIKMHVSSKPCFHNGPNMNNESTTNDNSEGPTVTGQQLVRLNSPLCFYSDHLSTVRSASIHLF